MANHIFSGIIRLRKDTESNWESVKDSFILADGEVALVETTSGIIKYKIGNGTSAFSELEYADKYLVDKIQSIVMRGYYYNGEFYADIAHTEKYVGYTHKIYVEINEHVTYSYDGEKYEAVGYVPAIASDTTPGIAKLYSSLGGYTDGSVQQKIITENFNKKVEMELNGETLSLFNIV